MRHFVVVMFMSLPIVATAEETVWTPMNGDEIRQALSGRVLSYGRSWQDFRKSGRTLYNAGADSWGYWRVQNDQYCSQWPPSDLWACYTMDRRGDALRFVGEDGYVSEAVYQE